MDNQGIKKAQMSQNIEKNEFLQSHEWLKFQEDFGRRTFSVEDENFSAKIIEHVLPVVGRYFYVPRGPVIKNSKLQISNTKQITNEEFQITKGIQELVDLAKKENAGWIRVEPNDSHLLDLIHSNWRVVKAPYDVQPKEIFRIDISKSEEQLLGEMKSKTRYNIRLAQKHEVSVQVISNFKLQISKKYVDTFLKLTKEMAARQGIVPHPDEYYQKMFETFPTEMLRLYVAEYNGNIISANLMLFFGDTATYLHGASSNSDRNVMAPFLLHWQAILDAKERGYKWYDFEGVQTEATIHKKHSNLSGVTAFKMGFSITTKSVVFPGTYDIIVNPRQYALYKGLQKAKMIVKKFKR